MLGDDDIGEALERELASTPRTLTADLYHYTSSDSAILGVLANRTFRLSPFQATNDLWESRPLRPNLEGELSGEGLPHEEIGKIWEDIDRFIRGHSKVGCFTQDWALPDTAMQQDALRGWGHLSMWAHYGARHTGVCLRFDRHRLIAAFEAAHGDAVHQFYGPVKYRTAEWGAGPHGISLEQAAEFGVDAVALHYASVHRERVFFRKHADWATESEFRLVRTDLSIEPIYIDITDALTGVILGEAFPMDRLPALLSMLDGFSDVELTRICFLNRFMHNVPLTLPVESPTISAAAPITSSMVTPRRDGTLADRLTWLDQVEHEATVVREAAVEIAAPLLQGWQEAFRSRPDLFDNWSDVVVTLYPRATAIPPDRRRNPPGVPGDEDIAYDAGLMIVAENQPQYSYTFVVAVALQVKSTGGVRLHGCVTIEQWRPDGNDRRDMWRVEREATPTEASEAANKLVADLIDAVPSARSRFDELRG
ncbi:MAG: DUF2971 domain-containing protein [Nocardioidaceae bacterium]